MDYSISIFLICSYPMTRGIIRLDRFHLAWLSPVFYKPSKKLLSSINQYKKLFQRHIWSFLKNRKVTGSVRLVYSNRSDKTLQNLQYFQVLKSQKLYCNSIMKSKYHSSFDSDCDPSKFYEFSWLWVLQFSPGNSLIAVVNRRNTRQNLQILVEKYPPSSLEALNYGYE